MRPQPELTNGEVLAGLVERVTYHNAENGFCVLRAKVRGHRDVVTVVGHAAAIAAGEWITASGEWVNDRTHGQQFKARFLRTSAPTSADGIEKYLSSGMIRGVGPVYAKKLVRAFGEKVFDVIEGTPDRLREVEGIGPVRAASILAAWAEQKAVREIMVFLHSHGASCALHRPRRQAHDRSDRLRGQDHPPALGGRPQGRRLQTRRRQPARLRPAGGRRGIHGRCPADAGAHESSAGQGCSLDRWRHRPAAFVGPGQVLADSSHPARASGRLTEVFRQAAQSRIITGAHRINQGSIPDLSPPGTESDFYFVQADDPETAVARIIELVKTRIPKRFGLDPIRDIQVLCPMNRGGVGARSLNIELQAALNPASDHKVEDLEGPMVPTPRS